MKEGLIAKLAYQAELFDGTQGSRYKEAMRYLNRTLQLSPENKEVQKYLDYVIDKIENSVEK